MTPTHGNPDLYINTGTAGCHSGGSAEGRGPHSGTMPTLCLARPRPQHSLFPTPGATLDATQLPDRATAESSHTDPGDDALAAMLVRVAFSM